MHNLTDRIQKIQKPVTYKASLPFSLNLVQKGCSQWGAQCLFQSIDQSASRPSQKMLYKFDDVNCNPNDFSIEKPTSCVLAVVTHTSGNLIHLVGYMHSTALDDNFRIDLNLNMNEKSNTEIHLKFICRRQSVPLNFIVLTDSNFTITVQSINNTLYSDRVLLMCAWQIPSVISINVDREMTSFLLLDQEMNMKIDTMHNHDTTCKWLRFFPAFKVIINFMISNLTTKTWRRG